MCTQPIRIYNNSHYVDLHCFAGTMQVPCGTCPECQSSRHRTYMARAYYESLRTIEKKGFCLFDTLTYAPKYLPTINGIPCFNHDDIVKFRKRLRIQLQRDGWTISDDKEDYLRFFIVSEYGSHTHRPHYHLIAWSTVPDKAVNNGFRKFCLWDLHKAIRRAWTYGFTDKLLKKVDLNADGMGAIFYVTKYMQKSHADLNALHSDLKDVLSELSEDEQIEFLEKYRKYFQLRCWTSNGFGSYFLELLEKDESLKRSFLESGKVRIPSAKKNQFDFVPLGHYYTYRLFYDRVYNPETGKRDKFVLNDAGIDFKCSRLDSTIEKIAKVVNQARATMPIEIASQKGWFTGVPFSDLDIAIYLVCYRGRCCLDEDFDLIDKRDYHSFYKRCIDPKYHDTYLANLVKDKREYREYLNNHLLSMRYEMFEECEHFCRLLDPYLLNLRKDEEKKQLENERHYDNMRAQIISVRDVVDYQ